MLRVISNPKKRKRKRIRKQRKAGTRKQSVSIGSRFLQWAKKHPTQARALLTTNAVYGKMASIPKKRKRKVTRVRRNPLSKFVIGATLERSGRHYYFRQSTKSFVPSVHEATEFKSRALAERTAKSIIGQLPSNIRAIHVDNVR